MSSDLKFVTAEERSSLSMAESHILEYQRSGGTRGLFWDFTMAGSYPYIPCLLLETFGAKSGERRLAPLIFGATDGCFVIVASKGGAPQHPGWYFNIKEMPQVTVQVATQAFVCEWHEAEGDDRERVWEFMADLYPPYREYQVKTERTIPIVMLKPVREVEIMAV